MMRKNKIDIKALIYSREITVKDLYLYVRSKRLFILCIVLFFALIGLLRGISSPEVYTATSQLLPENSTNTNRLRSLTSLSSLQLADNNRYQINSSIYPDIATSADFLLSLLSKTYYFESINEEVSIQDYYTKYYQEDWVTTGIKNFKRLFSFKRKKAKPPTLADTSTDTLKADSNKVFLSKIKVLDLSGPQRFALKQLQSNLIVERTGSLISFSTTIPDQKVAAELNKDIIKSFIQFVEEAQVRNLQEDLNRIEMQKKKAKEEYYSAQSQLTSFQDQNRNLISQVARGTETRLNNEFTLAFSLYNDLAKQAQSTLVKIEDARPQITVIQQPMTPQSSSNIGVVALVLISAFIGAFIAFGILGVRVFFYFFKAWLDAK